MRGEGSVIPNIYIGYRAHAVPLIESHSPAWAVNVCVIKRNYTWDSHVAEAMA